MDQIKKGKFLRLLVWFENNIEELNDKLRELSMQSHRI